MNFIVVTVSVHGSVLFNTRTLFTTKRQKLFIFAQLSLYPTSACLPGLATTLLYFYDFDLFLFFKSAKLLTLYINAHNKHSIEGCSR